MLAIRMKNGIIHRAKEMPAVDNSIAYIFDNGTYYFEKDGEWTETILNSSNSTDGHYSNIINVDGYE